MRGADVKLPPYLAELVREYRLGTLFHCAPSALLDEPAFSLTWYLEIDQVAREAERG